MRNLTVRPHPEGPFPAARDYTSAATTRGIQSPCARQRWEKFVVCEKDGTPFEPFPLLPTAFPLLFPSLQPAPLTPTTIASQVHRKAALKVQIALCTYAALI